MALKKDQTGSVGIGELKAKLSGYVERVRYGEQIIVTDHGEEVALLVPLSRERRVIKSLIESGMAQWSGGKPNGLEGVVIKGKPLSETILEDRQ
ncbi:MAG: type II toxin-antitoxin system prevent-host-death family antitoxin [Nitrospirae bacterium]|nr:type II toxin-antitoxin system prevent-host-death family antitoxin [Nitrospirota bacterium]